MKKKIKAKKKAPTIEQLQQINSALRKKNQEHWKEICARSYNERCLNDTLDRLKEAREQDAAKLHAMEQGMLRFEAEANAFRKVVERIVFVPIVGDAK